MMTMEMTTMETMMMEMMTATTMMEMMTMTTQSSLADTVARNQVPTDLELDQLL